MRPTGGLGNYGNVCKSVSLTLALRWQRCVATVANVSLADLDPGGMQNWLRAADPRPTLFTAPEVVSPMGRTATSSRRRCLACDNSLHDRHSDHSLDLGRGFCDLRTLRLDLIFTATPARVV